MDTSFIALGVAATLVGAIVIAVAVLSLVSGAFDFLFGKPRLTFLKSRQGQNGFAFRYRFSPSRLPGRFDQVRLRLFNPFGKPTQYEVLKSFDPQGNSFEIDLDLGAGLQKILRATGLKDALIQVELLASADGLAQQHDFKASRFLQLREQATASLQQESTSSSEADAGGSIFDSYITHLPKNMVEDTVPGKGAYLKIATNPIFAESFGGPVPGQPGKGASGAGEGAPAEENFEVKKVWIAPGCIVCDACETIYPEVFDVQADTCVIRPEASPGSELLKNGLLIQEAAEACPVEVIKFDKAQ